MDKIIAAKKLWTYLNIDSAQSIQKADAILVFLQLRSQDC